MTEAVRIAVGSIELDGDLTVPERSRGVVMFAHGSGSSRKSPRNRFVASVLQRAGLSTLLFDLLTPDEEVMDEVTAEFRFDIALLAERLTVATDWLRTRAPQQNVGYFGASTGAAAALIAAAARGPDIAAVVSRGGRPDLAAEDLPRVQAATLLIVGGNDEQVLALNEQALSALTCEKKLEVVPGATHLFEEAGALERVAELARDWFTARL
jgi:putative phosphoribosyl transferase